MSSDIHFRLDDETNAVFQSKLKASNMSKSEFVRQMILNGQVNPITNGKEIAQQIGLIHQDMINYHNDVIDYFQNLQSVVEDQNHLLQNPSFVNNLAVKEILQMQQLEISAIANKVLADYKAKERKAEEKMHNIIEIVTVEKR